MGHEAAAISMDHRLQFALQFAIQGGIGSLDDQMQLGDPLTLLDPQQHGVGDPLDCLDLGLDRLRRHLDPADIEHIVRASENDKPIGFRLEPEIAGHVPPVDEALRSQRVIPQIARDHPAGPDHDHAGLAQRPGPAIIAGEG